MVVVWCPPQQEAMGKFVLLENGGAITEIMDFGVDISYYPIAGSPPGEKLAIAIENFLQTYLEEHGKEALFQ